MLLQKTSSHIRHLLSIRRSNGHDRDDASLPSEERSFNGRIRTRSWISQTRPSSEVATLRRVASTIQTHARGSSSSALQSQKLLSARSSASSLCSCDTSMPKPHSSHPLSKSKPRSPFPPPNINIVYLDDQSSPVGDARTWNMIFPDEEVDLFNFGDRQAVSPTLRTPVLPIADAGSTFDLLEALQLEPMDGERTPRQEPHNASDSAGEFSEDVEQLIKETDAAFKAVGFALADAKSGTSATAERYSKDNIDVMSRLPSRVLRKQHRTPVTRNASVSKTKRKRSGNTVNLNPGLKEAVQRPVYVSTTSSISTQSPRWTLTDMTDNVTELFKFRKLEVDEMLTPDRVIQQRLETEAKEIKIRETEVASRRSSIVALNETTPTEDVPTPLSPFHLQDLPARIIAEVQNSSNTSSALSVYPSPGPPPEYAPPIPRKSKRRSKNLEIIEVAPQETPDVSPETLQGDGDAFEVRGMTFPSPPTPSPPRFSEFKSTAVQRVRSATIRRPSELTTIDEVSPLTPSVSSPLLPIRGTTKVARKRNRSAPNSIISPMTPITPASLHGRPSIFNRKIRPPQSAKVNHARAATEQVSPSNELNGTTYTLTSPLFQHGTIRRLGVSSNRQQNRHLNGIFMHRSRDTSVSSTESISRLQSKRRSAVSSNSFEEASHQRIFDYSIFQNATSGGTGDFFQDNFIVHQRTSITANDAEVDIDELLEWWAGHNIALGGLVPENKADTQKQEQKPNTVSGEKPAMPSRMLEGTAKALVNNEVVVSDPLLVDGEAVIQQYEKRRQQAEREAKKALLRQKRKSPESKTEVSSPQQSSLDTKQRYRCSNSSSKSIPESLRVGYAATPVREAAYRRANWGGIEKCGEIEKLGVETVSAPRDDEGYGEGIFRAEELDEEDGDEESEESGPPSPIGEFRTDAQGDLVLMGNNLSHDIGDFLRWENEHVERIVE